MENQKLNIIEKEAFLKKMNSEAFQAQTAGAFIKLGCSPETASESARNFIGLAKVVLEHEIAGEHTPKEHQNQDK